MIGGVSSQIGERKPRTFQLRGGCKHLWVLTIRQGARDEFQAADLAGFGTRPPCLA